MIDEHGTETLADRYDVVVVGGGIAGLVAGAYTAGAGATTLVLDGHKLGGRGRSNVVPARDGSGSFTLNTGAHALYDAGELRAVLTDLGIAVSGGVPTDLYLWKDGARHVLPFGAGSMLRTTGLSMRGKAAAIKLLGLLPMLRPAKLEGTTMEAWLADLDLPEDAEALVRCLVRTTTYSHAPELIDAGAVLMQLQRALKGVTYLDGGWQSIVDGLAAAATSRGARVVSHTGVQRVDADGAGWTIGVGGDREIGAAAVILAAGGPAVATRLLGLDPAHLDIGPPVRAAGLDVGLAGPAPVGAVFSAEGPLYVSRHMPPARLGPEGHDLLSAIRYLGPDEHPTPVDGQAELWAHVARAGVERDDPAIVADRYLHDLVVSHGMPLASRGGFRGRPDEAVAGSDGVFLAGDWVGRSSGLLADASAASGRRSAELAVARAAAVGPGRTVRAVPA